MKKLFLLLAAFVLIDSVSAQLPKFVWARAPFGQGGTSIAASVVADISGNVYTSGTFRRKTDFDPGPGYDTAGTSTQGAFLVKYDSSGNFVWRKSVIDGLGASVALDDSGNVYQSGTFAGTVTFGSGPATVTRHTPGVSNFLAKYNGQGTLQWVRNVCISGTYIGNVIGGGSLAVDHSGNVYQGGEYFSTADSVEFDSSRRYMFVLPWSRLKDSYLAKWNRNGILQWVRQVSGGDGEQISRVCIAPVSGNIIIGGYATGGDLFFPPNTRIYNSLGATDGFVAGFSTTGNFLWAKRIGGANHDFIFDLGVDKKGAIIASGFSYTNPTQTKAEAFVTKVNDTGAVQWRNAYGDNVTTGKAVAVDDSDNVYATGLFDSTANFNPGSTSGAKYRSASHYDMYLLKLRSNGNYVWSKTFTGSNAIDPERLYIDKRMNIYSCGTFYDSCDFNPGGGGGAIIANDHLGANQQGAFTVRFNQLGKSNAGVLYGSAGLPGISIFPNPAAHTLQVKGVSMNRMYEFVITDMVGRHYVVMPGSAGSQEIQLNLSNIPPACYVLTCRDIADGSTWQSTFVKSAE